MTRFPFDDPLQLQERDSLMKKILFILICVLFTASHLFAYAEESGNHTGSIGGEGWYAYWRSESGLDALGAVLVYDIEPSIVWGHSASLIYNRDGNPFTGFILDYFTSRMEERISEQVFETAEDNIGTYRKIRATLRQRVGESGFVHLRLMRASFKGYLTLDQGGAAFGVVNGSTWNMDSRWFKADATYSFDTPGNVLIGLGYRFFEYNKPQAIVDFYGTKEDSPFGAVRADSLISGKIEDTEIKGHHLLIGLWDKSSLGLPTDSPYFFDFLFYFGRADARSLTEKIENKIGGGIEASIGLKHSIRLSGTSMLTVRLGYRLLYHKVAIADERGEDERGKIYRGIFTFDAWHGPFFSLIWLF
jgi:hypothetical protein